VISSQVTRFLFFFDGENSALYIESE